MDGYNHNPQGNPMNWSSRGPEEEPRLGMVMEVIPLECGKLVDVLLRDDADNYTWHRFPAEQFVEVVDDDEASH